MAWSRGEALTDPAIKNPIVFLSEFRFHLPDIPTEITLRLYRPVHSGHLIVRRSHDLSIANIAPPSPASPPGDLDDEGEALHQVVDEMVCLFNAARAQGLKPSADWLKPNKDFN